jgi:hypothetical protein
VLRELSIFGLQCTMVNKNAQGPSDGRAPTLAVARWVVGFASCPKLYIATKVLGFDGMLRAVESARDVCKDTARSNAR